MQPEELEGINEESGCGKKDEFVSEEAATAQIYILQEPSEIFHNIEGIQCWIQT